MTQAKAVLLAIGAPLVFALLLLSAAPSAAHHKSSHSKGKPGKVAKDKVDNGDNRHPSGKDKSVENGGSGTQGNSSSDPDDDGRGPDRSNGGADKPGGPGGVDLDDQDGNNGCGNDDDFEDDNEGWCGSKPKKPKNDKKAKKAKTATKNGVLSDVVKKRTAARCEEEMAAGARCERKKEDGSCVLDEDMVSGTSCDEAVASDDDTCPLDATMAGTTCSISNDVEETVVLSERISRDGAPSDEAVVLGERIARPAAAAADVAEKGSPLAFTGTSLAQFILVALLLIDAGVMLLWLKRTA